MVYVYALWNSSGNPPSPWSKVTTYDTRFVRFTSNTSQGLTTGGSDTHTHTVTSITCDEVTDTATMKFNTASACLKSITNQKHSHGTSGVTFNSANNLPAYYTLALIRCEISQFFNSDAGGRRLYQYTVCASTQSISYTGYSRFTSADGKYIRLSSTVGSSGGSNSHTHSVSGSLDNYTGTTMTSEYGTSFLAPVQSGKNNHNHSVSASSGSASCAPAYLQTRLYQITSSQASIPVNAVLFVDGSISGYTDYFQILSGWNGYCLASGDVNPTAGGSDSHNHGSYIQVSSWYSSNPTYGAGGSTNSAILATHTHTVTVNLNTTDVSHLPPYVHLIPVAVIKEINPLVTRSKTYTANLLMQKSISKTYTADIQISLPGGKYYSMDVLLQKRNITKTYTMDLLSQLLHSKTYTADLLIQKRNNRNTYRMGLKVWRPAATYTMGITIISTAKPVGSVINTLLDSYIDQFNKIMQKIQAASGNMKIEYASGEALENKWGRVYNMPRKPEETDTEYRSRLISYEQSVLGSGTAQSVKNALNLATKGTKTRLLVLPGKIYIYFDDDAQRRKAKEIQASLPDILQMSVAAGVQAYVYLNYIDLVMGLTILKKNIAVTYRMSPLIAKRLTAQYTCNLISIIRKTKTYTANVILKKSCTVSIPMHMALKKTCQELYDLDIMMLKQIALPYNLDVVVQKQNITLTYTEKIQIQKTIMRPYQMKMLLAGRYAKFYKMHLVTKGMGESSYNMSIIIAE